MAFCRFSSMNWQCDLYCYSDCDGGITTHVAAQRHTGYIPPLPSVTADQESFTKLYRAHMDAVHNSPKEKISLPFAGETFRSDTVEDLKMALRELRELGYIFPDELFKLTDALPDKGINGAGTCTATERTVCFRSAVPETLINDTTVYGYYEASYLYSVKGDTLTLSNPGKAISFVRQK